MKKQLAKGSYRSAEEVVERADADRGQHLTNVLLGMRHESHGARPYEPAVARNSR